MEIILIMTRPDQNLFTLNNNHKSHGELHVQNCKPNFCGQSKLFE